MKSQVNSFIKQPNKVTRQLVKKLGLSASGDNLLFYVSTTPLAMLSAGS